MPIQALGITVTDQEIFPWINGVLLGWGLLALLPRWSKTQMITTGIALSYGLLYVALVVPVFFNSNPEVSFSDFGTLEGVRKAFANKDVVLGAWVHYAVFDLWTAKWIVADAQAHGLHHLLVIPCLLATMMLGPTGLVLYFILRTLLASKKAVKLD